MNRFCLGLIFFMIIVPSGPLVGQQASSSEFDPEYTVYSAVLDRVYRTVARQVERGGDLQYFLAAGTTGGRRFADFSDHFL